MKNRIKGIRTLVYFIVLLILTGVVCNVIIVEYVDSMRIRNILVQIIQVVLFLLVVMLIKNPRLAVPRMTLLDVVCIVMLLVSIGFGFAYMWKDDPIIAEIVAFQENNGYSGSYSNGTGDKGYYDIEKALENAIKKGTSFSNKLDEIYRIQIGQKIFVYLKKDEDQIIEFTFFKEDDLYYSIGSMCIYVLYDDRYTTEETIKGDIVNTMFRGVGRKEVGAPAWGVSTDDRIFSMTINTEPVDDVILINEKDGKKYYFWIVTNVGEIKTLDDVKAAEVTYEDEKNNP